MFSFLRLLCAVTLGSLMSSDARAIKQFYDEFVDLYTSEESEASDDFKELIADRKNKCLICHQGKKKKNHNAYGLALKEHLTKKDKKDVEKIVAALQTVAEQSKNPDDEQSPTFGEIIAQGDLPGGTYEECKEEPQTADEEAQS